MTETTGMTDQERFKNFYTIVANGLLGDDYGSVLLRGSIVRWLEQQVGRDFDNTEHFHEYCQEYMSKAGAVNVLAEIRDITGWSKRRMASFLGVAKGLYVELEGGTKTLNTKQLQLIRAKCDALGRGGKNADTQVAENVEVSDGQKGG